MSAPAMSVFALTDDELQTVGSRIGVTDFPVVLAIHPRYGTSDALDQASASAARGLTERGLVGTDGVLPELAELVGTLRRPVRELAVRLVTPDGLARITFVQCGSRCVSARRIGNDVQLRLIGERVSSTEMITSLLAELPGADPVRVESFGAPTAELAESLSGGDDSTYLTDRLRALGAGQQLALTLGSALGSRTAFAEIVFNVLDPSLDRVVRVPSAVAVFYTKRGRLVSAPSMSPSGQLWTTLKSGSNHRLVQSISQLTELAPGGWEEDAQ